MAPHSSADTTGFDQALVRDAGLVLVGEPLALDLANTRKTRLAQPRDMLREHGGNHAFWALEAHRLPVATTTPALEDTARLRDAIAQLTESVLEDAPVEDEAIAYVNRVAASATPKTRLSYVDGRFAVEQTWDADDAATADLAAVAASAIELLAGPDAERLRRCASEHCSMVFVATNAKRKWCTAEGCGNRARVARFSAARA
ncbi:CGNR zinc finger domain-containing protein [Plantibacter sp. Mn2098]|uniref:CGNR zinc finger domain-containing protein n=1 Tax=Plantibacter sp. Mn2098 TaxID=3395266 RepID=UPI003BCB25FD